MGDTAGMWGEMLGLGPLLKTVADPAFHDQIKTFLGAMQATYQVTQQCLERVDRIERKLDLLLQERGIDPDADYRSADLRPALPTQRGPAGNGGRALTASTADDGSVGFEATRRTA